MFEVNTARVRAELSQRGLSLRQFAQQSGINPATACKIVRDGYRTTIKTVGTLARFFGIDVDALILRKSA